MLYEKECNIACKICRNAIQKNNEEELRVIAELCNVSIGELFNYKGISLYDLMYKNGINTPVEYIFKMDGIFKGQLYCEFSYLMERLFIDATEEKILNSNEKEQEEIENILRNDQYDQQGSSNRILLKGGDLCVDGSRLRLRSLGS